MLFDLNGIQYIFIIVTQVIYNNKWNKASPKVLKGSRGNAFNKIWLFVITKQFWKLDIPGYSIHYKGCNVKCNYTPVNYEMNALKIIINLW